MGEVRKERYYVDLGRAHDYLLRCKDCRALVTYEALTKIGACDKCGNKRFIEITTLNEEEAAQINSGEITFPDSDKFMAEFSEVA